MGGLMNGVKEKEMVQSDGEEGLADMSGSHCAVSGKNGFCHTPSRVNTV